MHTAQVYTHAHMCPTSDDTSTKGNLHIASPCPTSGNPFHRWGYQGGGLERENLSPGI